MSHLPRAGAKTLGIAFYLCPGPVRKDCLGVILPNNSRKSNRSTLFPFQPYPLWICSPKQWMQPHAATYLAGCFVVVVVCLLACFSFSCFVLFMLFASPRPLSFSCWALTEVLPVGLGQRGECRGALWGMGTGPILQSALTAPAPPSCQWFMFWKGF